MGPATRVTTCLAMLLLPALVMAAGPAEAVACAACDAVRLGPAAKDVRYLWVHHREASAKRRAYLVIAGHVNSLSREPDIVPPAVILDDGTEQRFPHIPEAAWARVVLVRLNLKDYRWDPTVYFHLIEQDPFFHVPALVNGEKDWPLAPWLAETEEQRQALATLVNATQSQVPILRIDNFFWQTAIQEDRVVGYYGLPGFKTLADFEKAIGFDRKASEDFTRELLAAVANSGVSRQPRRIARYEKIGGAFWQTFDTRVAVDRKNPLRVLNDDFRFDASEMYGHLANGLWACFLADAQGVAQKSAPDFVGRDSRTHNRDGRIHVYLGCVRCHSDGGLQDIRDWVRRLNRPPTNLQSPDYQAALDLRRKYLRRLEPFLGSDRKRYADALAEANGLAPAQHAGNLEDYYAAIDSPVDLARAAEDLGTTPEHLVKMLRHAAVLQGQDTVLGMFLQKDPEPIPLEQWYEAIPLAQLALRGLTVWPQKEQR